MQSDYLLEILKQEIHIIGNLIALIDKIILQTNNFCIKTLRPVIIIIINIRNYNEK